MASYEDDGLPHKALQDAQLTLLFSEKAEKWADAKVTCKGLEWKVQQSILCMRCPFFEVCFRSGRFKEGETKTVDFSADEPYAVEALLIYLYTLEYPDRKSNKFEKPATAVEDSSLVVLEPRKKVVSTVQIIRRPKTIVSKTSIVANDEATNGRTWFKLKSEAPTELWQERLALYRTAHRLDLKPLCHATLGIVTREIDKTFRSSDVRRFITEVYNLGHDETRNLEKVIASRIVEQEPCVLLQPQLDFVVVCHPRFGCDMIKAMKTKETNQADAITGLQVLIDGLEQDIVDFSQGVKLSDHKAMVAAHKEELKLEREKSKDLRLQSKELKMQAVQLRKEAAQHKRAMKEQPKELNDYKRQVADLKKMEVAKQTHDTETSAD